MTLTTVKCLNRVYKGDTVCMFEFVLGCVLFDKKHSVETTLQAVVLFNSIKDRARQFNPVHYTRESVPQPLHPFGPTSVY